MALRVSQPLIVSVLHALGNGLHSLPQSMLCKSSATRSHQVPVPARGGRRVARWHLQLPRRGASRVGTKRVRSSHVLAKQAGRWRGVRAPQHVHPRQAGAALPVNYSCLYMLAPSPRHRRVSVCRSCSAPSRPRRMRPRRTLASRTTPRPPRRAGPRQPSTLPRSASTRPWRSSSCRPTAWSSSWAARRSASRRRPRMTSVPGEREGRCGAGQAGRSQLLRDSEGVVVPSNERREHVLRGARCPR